MTICSIILNWNGSKYISDTIESLLKVDSTGVNHQIIVVDNNSTDDSVTLIKNKFPQIRLLQNPINLGFAAGNNRGINYAISQNCDYIWIINSDISVAPDTLQKLLEGTKKYPLAGIYGAKIYFAPGYEYQKNRYLPNQLGKVIWYAGGIIDWKNVLASHRGVDEVDKGQYEYDLETDFITGAVMLIKKSTLESLHGFDPDYCFYFEENDLCQRAKKMGSRLMFIASAHAWHQNAQSTGMGSPLQDYFLTRNRLLFGMKYAPLRTKFALIREAKRLQSTGREWQKKAINDFFSRRFGAGSFELK